MTNWHNGYFEWNPFCLLTYCFAIFLVCAQLRIIHYPNLVTIAQGLVVKWNSNDTVWLSDPENSLFDAKILDIIYSKSRTITNFVFKFSKNCYHASKISITYKTILYKAILRVHISDKWIFIKINFNLCANFAVWQLTPKTFRVTWPWLCPLFKNL